MKTAPSIIELVTDPQLLGLNISLAQETVLRATYGEPFPSAEHTAIWEQCTGRSSEPTAPFGEVTVVARARSGKDSRIAAPIMVYEAVFGGHHAQLARGERAIVPLVAQDARAARIAFGYVKDYFTRSPLLAGLVEEPLTSELVLINRVTISCFPCTLRSLRGWSIPAAVMDELAFFRLEGQADSDVEVQASIRRGMVGFPRTRLLKCSTPYMKSGVLYEDFTRSFGKDDADVLVWRASSLLMNPSLRAERLERERRLDPLRFAREYEADFAEDLESFLPSAWADGAVVAGRHEVPPRSGVRYVAAVDPSGGAADAFTVAIVHVEPEGVIHDVMKGWGRPRDGAPLDLEGVVKEVATVCRRYGCATVHGDRYASGWVVQRFRTEGIRYVLPEVRRPGDTEATYLDKSMAYVETEPLFATGRIRLLDHPQLLRELKLLERRPRAGGKALVDHPAGGHDDFANSLCLAAALATRHRPMPWSGPALPPGAIHVGTPPGGTARTAPGQVPMIREGRVSGQAGWVRARYRDGRG
jgi:hypothetical protein